eukprot:1921689-Prymnesium_polylepis.1
MAGVPPNKRPNLAGDAGCDRGQRRGAGGRLGQSGHGWRGLSERAECQRSAHAARGAPSCGPCGLIAANVCDDLLVIVLSHAHTLAYTYPTLAEICGNLLILPDTQDGT